MFFGSMPDMLFELHLQSYRRMTMTSLDIIILVLIIMWLGGMSFGIAGGLIHLILVIAIVVLIFRLLRIGKV